MVGEGRPWTQTSPQPLSAKGMNAKESQATRKNILLPSRGLLLRRGLRGVAERPPGELRVVHLESCAGLLGVVRSNSEQTGFSSVELDPAPLTAPRAGFVIGCED